MYTLDPGLDALGREKDNEEEEEDEEEEEEEEAPPGLRSNCHAPLFSVHSLSSASDKVERSCSSRFVGGDRGDRAWFWGRSCCWVDADEDIDEPRSRRL
jgi:hypothetical protein